MKTQEERLIAMEKLIDRNLKLECEKQELALALISSYGQAFENWVAASASQSRELKLREALENANALMPRPMYSDALSQKPDFYLLIKLIRKVVEELGTKCPDDDSIMKIIKKQN